MRKCIFGLFVFILVFTNGLPVAYSKAVTEGRSQDVKKRFNVTRYGHGNLSLPADLPEAFSVVVEHNGVQKELYLWKHSVRSADYKVVGAKNGKYHHYNPGPVRTYVGVVADEPDHLVSALLDDRGLSAGVYQGRSLKWQVEPLGKVRGNASRNEHVVYDAEDEEPLPGICGIEQSVVAELHESHDSTSVAELSTPSHDTAELQAEEFVAALSAPEMLTGCELHQAEIAYVVDYAAFVNNFSCDITAAQNRVEQIVTNLTVIYGRDALVTYQLTGAIIRNDPTAMGFNAQYPWENHTQADPASCIFVDNDTNAGLGYAGSWNSQASAAGITSWHFVHLLTADNPGGILGVAYVPGTVAWSVNNHEVMAHEIGHNWGLGHCDGNGDCHIMCSGYGGCNGNPTFFGDPGASHIRDRGFSVNWVTNVGGLIDQVPPRAFGDSAAVYSDKTILIDILANDHEANCDTITIESFDSTSLVGGQITLSSGTGPDGRDQLHYDPPMNYEGSDTFTYTIGDGNGNQDTATVSVSVAISDRLIAYWKLDESSGSTAVDSSGHGYDGTLSDGFTFDASSVTGKYGGGLAYAAGGQLIDIGAPDIPAPWTAFMWVKRKNNSDSSAALLDSSVGSLRLEQWNNTNKVGVSKYGTTDSSFNYTAPIDTWVHLAFVGTDSDTSLYVDGIHKGTLSVSIPCPMDTIGTGPDELVADIDEVRVYNYNLSSAEITTIAAGVRVDCVQPPHEATSVLLNARLIWVPAPTAINNKVYFGTSYDAVANATTASHEYKATQSGSEYLPALLNDTEYFWRIDSVDSLDAVTTGPVWSFTTGNGTGAISRQVWTDISGGSVSDLTSDPDYPSNPDISDELYSFEAPTDWANNYGTRIHGFLAPKYSGSYTFWIAGDDNCQLWLSSDESPANTVQIAEVPGYTSSREWNKFTQQQSSPVQLVAGRHYYIRALHKEGGGGDNIAVAWSGPGFYRKVITGSHLMPYSDAYEWWPIFVSDPLREPDALEGLNYSTSLAGDAADPDGGAIIFTKVAGPDWLTVVANGSLSGVPGDLDAGMNYFTVRATDNEGAMDEATIKVMVHDTFTGELGLPDFAGLAGHWLDSGCVDVPACYGADLTDDAVVDLDDLRSFAGMWLIDYDRTGLETRWTFDTDATDAVGSNDGTLTNGASITATDPQMGAGSLSLDGTDDYVEMTGYYGIAGTASRTVSAWIKTTAVNAEIVTWGDVTAPGGRWIVRTAASGVLRLEAGYGKIEGTATINDGQWHHVAVVLVDDGSPIVSDIQLFVDGQPDTPSSAGDIAINTVTTVPVRVGICLEEGSGRYFAGQIDDVRIYDRALISAEISSLYISNTPALVSRWTFDTDATDAVGSNDGTLTNGASITATDPQMGAGSLSLDGTDDYVEMTGFNGIAGTASRTVSAWIKTTAVNAEIVTWGDVTAPGGRWIVRTAASGVLRLEAGYGKIEGTATINDGQWHHVAVVLVDDGSPIVSDIQLFVDGQPDTPSSAGDIAINTVTTVPVRVGICLEEGSGRYFTGQIDDVRIYDRAMTPNEVDTLSGN